MHTIIKSYASITVFFFQFINMLLLVWTLKLLGPIAISAQNRDPRQEGISGQEVSPPRSVSMLAFESPRISILQCNLSSIEIFSTLLLQMSQTKDQNLKKNLPWKFGNNKYIAKNINLESKKQWRLYVWTQRIHNIYCIEISTSF